MITSKLTSKAQTTLPQAVRKALSVGAGDEVGYAIRDGEVLLFKVATPSEAIDWDPFALFEEWNRPEMSVYDDL